METRELIIESPGRLRAKADAIENELVRMKSDIDLFVVGYSDVTKNANGYDDKSRKANGEELLLIAESAIKEMKKAASNKGLNISRQEVEVIRLISTALGISRLMI